MTGKSIRYHLEVYLDSMQNDPFASMEASTPFPTFRADDWIEPQGFGNPTEDVSGKVYKVKSVGHMMWDVERAHIAHKLVVVVELRGDGRYALDIV